MGPDAEDTKRARILPFRHFVFIVVFAVMAAILTWFVLSLVIPRGARQHDLNIRPLRAGACLQRSVRHVWARSPDYTGFGGEQARGAPCNAENGQFCAEGLWCHVPAGRCFARSLPPSELCPPQCFEPLWHCLPHAWFVGSCGGPLGYCPGEWQPNETDFSCRQVAPLPQCPSPPTLQRPIDCRFRSASRTSVMASSTSSSPARRLCLLYS